MDGEFNNLATENAKITFNMATDNIATSDELTADPIYQRQMGTAYSRGKKVSRIVTAAGITLLLTATAIKSGQVITNAFIVNPPKISNTNVTVENNILNYSFSIENVNGYPITIFLYQERVKVYEKDCTNPGDYEGTIPDLEKWKDYKFYVEFTNKFDYRKSLYTYSFTNKGVN